MWRMFLIFSYLFICISGDPTSEVDNFNEVEDNKHPHAFYEKRREEDENQLKNQLQACKDSYEKLHRQKRAGYSEDESIGKLFGLGFSTGRSNDNLCSMCTTIVGFLQVLLQSGSTIEELISLAMIIAESMHVMTPEICRGMLMHQEIPLMHILNTTTLSCGEICNLVIGDECEEPDPSKQWEVQIPKPKKPEVLGCQLPPKNAHKLKVLLLSDTHVDPSYKEGTWAECSLLICCRDEVGEPTPNATLSGKWGGWKCDTPWRTLINLFEHLAKEHPDIDYIVWTGDLNPHDLWSFSKNQSLAVIRKTVALFDKYFPNTPCYPALGNHEAEPANLFPTTEVDEELGLSWLYDELAKQWGKWLPEGCAEPIRRGGFYTVLVRPGFRIISLNTNFCLFYNWWLLINDNDPLGELKWLIEVLQAAEDNNEKVHIIGHVPPGRFDCLKIWQTNYLKILCRYRHTIAAQFFGHTHRDEFHLHFDPEDMEKICGVSFMIPGVTTYSYVNPGYQIAYIDGDHEKTTRYVLDKTTYVFDLEKANECDDYAVWVKSYSAKEAYNMSSLLPSEWKVVLDRIVTDDEFFCLYHKHFWKNSPVRPPCDEEWRQTYMSYIYSYAQYGEYKNQCGSCGSK